MAVDVMTARDLLIQLVVVEPPPEQWPGISAAFEAWLELEGKPIFGIANGQFVIHCASVVDARKISAEWGGNPEGRAVRGAIVDLTS